MFEKLKAEMGFTDLAARIEMKNGQLIYGFIVDHLTGEEPGSDLKFVKGEHFRNYRETENPCLIMKLREDEILGIDAYLK